MPLHSGEHGAVSTNKNIERIDTIKIFQLPDVPNYFKQKERVFNSKYVNNNIII